METAESESPYPSEDQPRSDIVNYYAPWDLYAFNFSNNPNGSLKAAIGSFIEDQKNYVQLVELCNDDQIVQLTEFEHMYPPTKIMWNPVYQGGDDWLATSGDIMRLWSINQNNEPTLITSLINKRPSEHCGPLTSFDWHRNSPNIIGTSSIDQTCTIWDIHKQEVVKQLIAHDKEVCDIAFTNNPSVFATAGADSQVRQFDLRDLRSCQIMHDNLEYKPVLRIDWNNENSYYLAIVTMDSPVINIVDSRNCRHLLQELRSHTLPVNAISWGPGVSTYLSSASDDCMAYIWNLEKCYNPIEEPCMVYNAHVEITNLQWSNAYTDRLGIAFNNTLQVLKI